MSNQSETIASEKVFADRKVFYIDLKKNDRGRYIKITEDVAGRRDTIVLPITAVPSFEEAFNRLMEANSQT